MELNLGVYQININDNKYNILEIKNDIPKIIDKDNDLFKGELIVNQQNFKINTDNGIDKQFYLQTQRYNLYSQSVIFSEEYKVIGNIKEVFSFFDKHYNIYDKNSKKLYSINGNQYGFKIFKDKNQIGEIIPNVAKKSIKELVNNTNFRIEFFNEYIDNDYQVLLGALIHIDMSYVKKSMRRVILKRIIGYTFLTLLIIFISLLAYRAHYIFSLDDDLVLDNNISVDDKIDTYPIEEDPNLTFDKDFLYDVKKTYSKPLYNYFNPKRLFKYKNNMPEQKKDFYRLLDLYMKTDKLFIFKNDGLFYRIMSNKLYGEPNSLLIHFELRNFYESLIYYIKYLDEKKNNQELADKLLNKLVISLNNLIENSYYFDYIAVNGLYKLIFEKLKCSRENRKFIFKGNSNFFKKQFNKRLKAESEHLKGFFIIYIDKKILNDMVKKKRNRIFRISIAMYENKLGKLLKFFHNYEINKTDKITQKERNIFLDSININIFSFNDTYIINNLANINALISFRKIERYAELYELIIMQEKL